MSEKKNSRVEDSGEAMSEVDARAGGGGGEFTIPFGEFRRLTFWSVLCGLCPLIPVPFLDDWILGRVKRRMVRDVAANHAQPLSGTAIKHLSGQFDARPGRGCLWVFLWVWKALLKLFGKFFRTVFYVLAVRTAIRVCVESFHEGYLVANAAGDSARSLEDSAPEVRGAVLRTIEDVNTDPAVAAVSAVFKSSRSLLRQGARLLRRFSRKSGQEDQSEREAQVLDQEERLLSRLVDRLAGALWNNQDYFRGLQTLFEHKLAHPGAAPVHIGPDTQGSGPGTDEAK